MSEDDLLTLDLPTEPYWLDLPHKVRVRVRPLDTALFEAARARGMRKVRELVEHVAAVREAGGDVSGLPDLADADVISGLAQSMLMTALAEIGIVAWEGVKAPLSADAAAKLMRRHDVATAFFAAYLAPVAAASAEGNASAAGLDGISEPGGATAKDAGAAA